MFTTPQAIAALVQGRVEGDPQRSLVRITTLQSALPDCVSFLSNPRYRSQLASTKAGCVIVAERLLPLEPGECSDSSLVVVSDPYLAYARLSQWWAAQQRVPLQAGIHASAVVEEGARIHRGASVGPLCHVAAGAVVGDGAVLGPHCVVGPDAEIGAQTRLSASVTILQGCVVGDRGLLHPGVVIGADGFGFAPQAGAWVKIEQLGAVRIGHDVEIGANTCVDRGALEDTVIEDGVKLDNLIQIGHNVHIGRGSAMAGCVGVAGSATIGQRCTVGGGAIILGHLTLADDVHVSAATVVTRSITKPGQYSGVFPFDDNAAWEKNAATLRQLHQMRDRLRQLEKKLPLTMLDIHRILKLLPHRYPILLVDRVLSFEKDKRIQALKNVTINEPFFQGHFPSRPVMPGVLMLEALAQTAALLSFESAGTEPGEDTVVYFVGIDGARFKRVVEPGDQLLLNAEIERARAGIFKYKAWATVGDEVAVEAELMCTMRKVS